MTFETQLNEIVKDYRKQYTRTPETVLRVRAITDVILLIEKNMSVMMLRIKFNRNNPKRSEILLRGLDRLELRHSRLIGLLDRRESLPTNDKIDDPKQKRELFFDMIKFMNEFYLTKELDDEMLWNDFNSL
tara:strand:+ start:410 stop:802 length:393 start_codon:yes stop_codon:yes gene_type:complete